MSRAVRRPALIAVVVVGVLATAGAPAAAHGADAPDATAYRTVITATPDLPGLSVRAVEAGARLELTNATGRTVEVLGYAGEPYLEVRPDGVFTNVNSAATYLNEVLAGDVDVPAHASPTAPPQWRRVSTDATVRWHDRRTHWMDADLPAQAVADPGRAHRLRDWVVPLRVGVTPLELRGTLDWEPPPTPFVWWAGAVVLAVLCVTARRSRGLLAGVAAVAGTTTWGYAVARAVDAGTAAAGQVVPAVVGAGAIVAAVLAATRRPIGDFALAVSGASVVVFAGFADAGVFTQAVAPVPGPGWWARLAILVIIGTGGGLAAAAALRLRTSLADPSAPGTTASDTPAPGTSIAAKP